MAATSPSPTARSAACARPSGCRDRDCAVADGEPGERRGMAGTRLVLRSPLPVEGCLQRLRSEVDEGWSSAFGGHAVGGRIGAASLRLRKRIRYRNSFQTGLSAKLAEADGGTSLDC